MELEKILQNVQSVIAIDKFKMERFQEWIDQTLMLVENLIKYTLTNLPAMEKFFFDTIDTMFAPRQLVRQAMMIVGLQLSLIGMNSTYSAVTYLYHCLTRKGKQEKKLLDELSKAKSYNEWQAMAAKLDEFRGLDGWRSNPVSTLYDYKLVKKRIHGTKEMLDRGDVFDLMFRIRGALSRDQFGIQHERLFTRALGGTKHLIEEYHETMARALNFICDSPIADEEVSNLFLCLVFFF